MSYIRCSYSPTTGPVCVQMLWSVLPLALSAFRCCDQSYRCPRLCSAVLISPATGPVCVQMLCSVLPLSPSVFSCTDQSCHWLCLRSDVVISPTTGPVCVQMLCSVLPLSPSVFSCTDQSYRCVCLRADWARRAGAWAQPRGWSRASWRRGRQASWVRRSSGGCAASWPRPSTAWTPPPSWRRNCGRKSTPPSEPPSTSPLSRTCSTRRSPLCVCVCVCMCARAWFLQDPPSPQRKVNLKVNWRMVGEREKKEGGGGWGERGRWLLRHQVSRFKVSKKPY